MRANGFRVHASCTCTEIFRASLLRLPVNKRFRQWQPMCFRVSDAPLSSRRCRWTLRAILVLETRKRTDNGNNAYPFPGCRGLATTAGVATRVMPGAPFLLPFSPGGDVPFLHNGDRGMCLPRNEASRTMQNNGRTTHHYVRTCIL